MAFDKVIDSAKLDAAMKATADSIRSKTGSSAKIAWNENTGFSGNISGIVVEGGGSNCPNGKEWTVADSDLNSSNYPQVVYANGFFVRSWKGSLETSTDGKNWTKPEYLPDGDYWIQVAGPAVFVQNYASGQWYYTLTKDGAYSWESTAVPNGTSNIMYVNGYYVAYGDSGIYYKSNIYNWDWTQAYSVSVGRIEYVGGMLLAALSNSNSLAYSQNVTTWTRVNPKTESGGQIQTQIYGFLYTDGAYVATSVSGIFYSYDGKSWARSNFTGNGLNLSRIVYNGCFFVVTSQNGIKWSSGGNTWNDTNITECAQSTQLVLFHGKLFAVASDKVYLLQESYEEPYFTWEPVFTFEQPSEGYQYTSIYDCASNDTVLIAIGYEGREVWNESSGIWELNDRSISYYSYDGVNWAKTSVAVRWTAYGNGMWVAWSQDWRGKYTEDWYFIEGSYDYFFGYSVTWEPPT